MTERLRVLLSYSTFRGKSLEALFSDYFTEPYPDVFVDSGAYTALTKGIDIDVQAYIRWVKENLSLMTTYANLDVIGDWKASQDNLKAMQDAGLKPLPVYHGGEPLDILEDMIETYNYVAIGGMTWVSHRSPEMVRFLIQVHKMAEGRAALHGFGNTYWAYMRRFPWYSVDGSTWVNGFRYGKVRVFDEMKGKFFSLRLRHPEDWGKRSNLVARYGFDWKEFARPDTYQGDEEKIKALVHISYRKAEHWLLKRFGPIEIPANGKVDNVANEGHGPKLYLALSRSMKQTVSGADVYVREHFDV